MKYLLYLSFFVMAITFVACEGEDDDYGTPLIYEVCDATLTFPQNERTNIQQYSLSEIPNNVRSYIAGEFAGFAIQSATSFEVNDGSQYVEVIVDNNGSLLFDSEGVFLCGDDSLSSGGYGDDDDDDDEYINPENLPQAILDYIAENYPNATIEEAEFEDGEYEVELNNDVELCFDSQGNFIGTDC